MGFSTRLSHWPENSDLAIRIEALGEMVAVPSPGRASRWRLRFQIFFHAVLLDRITMTAPNIRPSDKMIPVRRFAEGVGCDSTPFRGVEGRSSAGANGGNSTSVGGERGNLMVATGIGPRSRRASGSVQTRANALLLFGSPSSSEGGDTGTPTFRAGDVGAALAARGVRSPLVDFIVGRWLSGNQQRCPFITL